MKKRIQWRLETRKLSELKPYDKNPRIITDESLEELRKSFDEIGEAQPININQDGTILSGHARYKVLLSEDPEREVSVYVPDRLLTPKQEEAVIIRMNKNIAGQWDFEKLQSLFELDDLLEWGFTESELALSSQDFDSPKSTSKSEDALGNIKDTATIECPACGYKIETHNG
jgi:site-specific DNA-methyltransferase (adenine-specific)